LFARLSPGLSPKVYDYGFLENVEVDAKEGKTHAYELTSVIQVNTRLNIVRRR
jgi:hypothetical protein